MSEAQDDLRARRDEWRVAVDAGDLDAYTGLVTDDLVWLPPTGAPIKGRDSFRAWLEPFMDRYTYDFFIEPAEVRLFEGYCAEAGSFKSIMSDKTGGARYEHGGSYAVIWRMDEDGTWRIERYVDGFGSGVGDHDR